jgi:hypothetical protein
VGDESTLTGNIVLRTTSKDHRQVIMVASKLLQSVFTPIIFILCVFSQIKKERKIFVLAGTLCAQELAQVILQQLQKSSPKGQSQRNLVTQSHGS